MRNKKAEK